VVHFTLEECIPNCPSRQASCRPCWRGCTFFREILTRSRPGSSPRLRFIVRVQESGPDAPGGGEELSRVVWRRASAWVTTTRRQRRIFRSLKRMRSSTCSDHRETDVSSWRQRSLNRSRIRSIRACLPPSSVRPTAMVPPPRRRCRLRAHSPLVTHVVSRAGTVEEPLWLQDQKKIRHDPAVRLLIW
jgi:hypothetical protein